MNKSIFINVHFHRFILFISKLKKFSSTESEILKFKFPTIKAKRPEIPLTLISHEHRSVKLSKFKDGYFKGSAAETCELTD